MTIIDFRFYVFKIAVICSLTVYRQELLIVNLFSIALNPFTYSGYRVPASIRR